jgi:hypothetical protein
MLATGEPVSSAESTSDTDEAHPLDAFVHDPSGRPPLCSEERFAAIMESIVADYAPRVFAVVQEYGKRVDGKIAAWGLAFEDRIEVIGVEGGIRISGCSPEDALLGFHFGSHIKPRLVWVNPDAATPAEDDQAL